MREQAAQLIKQMPPRTQESLEGQDSDQRKQFELWAAHGSKTPKNLASAIDNSRRSIERLERERKKDIEAVQKANQRLKDSIAANESHSQQDKARSILFDAQRKLALRLITLGNNYENHDALIAFQKRASGQIASAAQPTNRTPAPAPSPPSPPPMGRMLTISDLTPAERKDVERVVAQERIEINRRTTELNRTDASFQERFLARHYNWLLTSAGRNFDSLDYQADLVRAGREALTRGAPPSQTTELQNSLHWARVRLIAHDQILDMYIAELRRWAASNPEVADKQRLVPSNSKPFVFPQAGQTGRLFSLPGRKLTIPTAPPIHVVDSGLPAYRLWRDCLHARTGGPNPERRDRVHCQDLDPKGRREFDSDLAIFGPR